MNKVIHPGKYKQNVNVALLFFHETSSAAIKCYFSNHSVSASFLTLFKKWWLISNSKRRTLLCHALLIEELLIEGYDYVLKSRFQSDPIEGGFGQYHQMSGGKFLVNLKDVIHSENIIKIKSLIKEGIDLFQNDLKEEEKYTDNFNEKITEVDFSSIKLSDESQTVATHIAGFVAKK